MPLSMKKQENFTLFLEKNAYGKRALDDGLFNKDYTEVQTFSELEFIEKDGRLEADITQTKGYKKYYQPGATNHGKTEAELVLLAKSVGIKFDSQTKFDGKI